MFQTSSLYLNPLICFLFILTLPLHFFQQALYVALNFSKKEKLKELQQMYWACFPRANYKSLRRWFVIQTWLLFVWHGKVFTSDRLSTLWQSLSCAFQIMFVFMLHFNRKQIGRKWLQLKVMSPNERSEPLQMCLLFLIKLKYRN